MTGRKFLPVGVFVFLLATLLTGCKDFPGADGRYASGWPRAGPGPWAP